MYRLLKLTFIICLLPVFFACSSSVKPVPSQPNPSLPAVTGDEPEPPLPVKSKAEIVFSSLTKEQKVGQLLIVPIPDSSLNDETLHQLRQNSFINIILFARNIPDAETAKKLTGQIQSYANESFGMDALIAVDQEGGRVVRIRDGMSAAPSAREIGQTGDPKNAYQAGYTTAVELLALGINFNLAPVFDVDTNEKNPIIGDRAFSSNPVIAADFALQYAKGQNDAKMPACAKHFPGHGDTSVDSHKELPILNHDRNRLDAVELYPFRRAAEEGIDTILAGHIACLALDESGLPASLSEKMLTGLLREEYGYKGVILTDSMGMDAISSHYSYGEAAVLAISAGADMIIAPESFEAQSEMYHSLLSALSNGELSPDRLSEAVMRILILKEKYGLLH